VKLSKLTGADLLEWRTRRGWKRNYLSQLLGVSTTTLWSWEKDEALPLLVALACRAVDDNLKPMGE